MMQATRVIVVLFFVMIVATQFSTDNLVVAQTNNGVSTQSSCLDECKDKQAATPIDTTLSVIGCLGSALVVLYPWVRVTKRIDLQENIVRDKWFMAFIGIVAQTYALWTVYSFEKCNCEAKIYMVISSIVGVVVSGLYFLIGLVRGVGNVMNRDEKVIAASLFIFLVALISFADDINTYAAMVGTLVAHVCRILGTDYTHFSGAQCILSIVGVVSGFLSIRHPHLTKARPFCITSFVVAVVRFFEFGWWLLLFVRRWLQEKSTQRVVPESELQPPVWQPQGSIQQTQDEYMKELQKLNM